MASWGTAPGKTTRAISAESIRRAEPCSSGWRCHAAPASAGSSPTGQTYSIAVADRPERFAPSDVRRERRENDDRPQDGNTCRVARGAARAAEGREGAHTAQRRGGAAAAGAAVGAYRQEVPVRDGRGVSIPRRSFQRKLAAPRLPFHVRARLHGGVYDLLDDRGWVQRLRRPSRQSRRHAVRGVAGAVREAAGIQAADGLDVSLGVV